MEAFPTTSTTVVHTVSENRNGKENFTLSALKNLPYETENLLRQLIEIFPDNRSNAYQRIRESF